MSSRDRSAGLGCERLSDLCRATAAMLRLGRATRRLMERLLGLWTQAIVLRRLAFSLFDRVYKWLRNGLSHVVAPLPRRVRDELFGLVALAPCLRTNLGAGLSDA